MCERRVARRRGACEEECEPNPKPKPKPKPSSADVAERGVASSSAHQFQETALGALSITQVPRMDVSLADLLDKTGVVPEGMIGALVLQLLPTLHLLHTVCRCVHNDLDARNIFVCCSTGAVRLSGFCYGTNSQKCFI